MDAKRENTEKSKVEELMVEYEVQKPEFSGREREAFEFEKGVTLKEAKAESIRRIKECWGR